MPSQPPFPERLPPQEVDPSAMPDPVRARLNLLRKENEQLIDMVVRLSRIVAGRLLEK